MKNYSPRLFDLYKNDIQSLLKDKLGIDVNEDPEIQINDNSISKF